MNSVISITFGDQAENHVGMQKIGTESEHGFTIQDLITQKETIEKLGFTCELINLKDGLSDELKPFASDAMVLIIKQGLSLFDIDHNTFYNTMSQLNVDKKALMRGKVVNKHARWNLTFGDANQDPDYSVGKGRIIKFEDISDLNKIRTMMPNYLGDKSKDLVAELNLYYDITKCGIGFHGDTERKIVICARLGANLPLHYQWYLRNNPIGNRIILNIDGGDIYIMSEKAVGSDWKKSSILTLRHAAGCDKYVK